MTNLNNILTGQIFIIISHHVLFHLYIFMCCLGLQAVEGVVLLPQKQDFSQIGVKSKDLHFVTAGSKGFAPAHIRFKLLFEHVLLLTSSPFPPAGVLRVWEASTARCVYTQTLTSTLSPVSEDEEEKDDDPRSLVYLLHLPTSSRLATVTAEHNILLYQLPALTTQQQVFTDFTLCKIQYLDHGIR